MDQLGEELGILARRVYEHRKANHGWTPREIFTSCLGLGGVYFSAEIVVQVVDDTADEVVGYALKKRESADIGWADQYHSPGLTVTMLEDPAAILQRLTHEIFGDSGRQIDEDVDLEDVGVERHHESLRTTTCWSYVRQLLLYHSELPDLQGKWIVFTDPKDPRIIDHHQAILTWAMDEGREYFVDLENFWAGRRCRRSLATSGLSIV